MLLIELCIHDCSKIFLRSQIFRFAKHIYNIDTYNVMTDIQNS